MALILKSSLNSNEVQFLTEKGLLFDKNESFYGVRDKDLENLLDTLKKNSLNEAQSLDDINARAYSLRVTTLIMQMLKDATTFNDYVSLLSCINSLYPIAPEEALRLLSVLKSSIKW